MTHKTQKIFSTTQIAIVVVGGLEALAYILNLNQPAIYIQVAFWIFLYLLFNIVFLFDVHFKSKNNWQAATAQHGNLPVSFNRNTRIIVSAFWKRFHHLRKWAYVRQWLHFLLIPSFIFWATISLFYINFGFVKSQQIIVALSSVALILYFWYLKEVFYRQQEIVDSDIFVAMTMIKIYTVFLLYAASLSMLRYYCLHPLYFGIEVFCFTFLLIYQALYQHRRVNGATVAITTLIAALMAVVGYLVYVVWGFNYFTAAIFMTVAYNLFWGIFHYRLDRSLTRHALIELVMISFLIGLMVISVTNFRARILDGCNYSSGVMR